MCAIRLSTELIRIIVCLGDAAASQESTKSAKAGPRASTNFQHTITDELLANIETLSKLSNEMKSKLETAESKKRKIGLNSELQCLRNDVESQTQVLNKMKTALRVLTLTSHE